jgi:hypothetical protein
MEGARMLDEWPIIEARIPHRGIVFVPTTPTAQLQVAAADELDELESLELDLPSRARAASRPASNTVTPVEANILKLLDATSTVDDVVRKSVHGEFETCKALYMLLTRDLIREATQQEARAARDRYEARALAAAPPTTRLPWLALLLIPLLLFSQLLANRNPLNPLLGQGPKILPRIAAAYSFSRMWGVWQVLHARAALVGSYPDNLAELVSERLLSDRTLRDPWSRAYRYVLREQAVLLAGSTPDGVPDPNLILSRHLGAEGDAAMQGQGATLVTP